MSPTIGFVGCGNMAKAMIKGFINKGGIEPASILVTDTNATQMQTAEQWGCRSVPEISKVFDEAEMVIIAVKPHQIFDVLPKRSVAPLVVSICAGVSLNTICHKRNYEKVVRVMPNTGCLVGESASCFSCNSGVTAVDKQMISKLLSTVGSCHEVQDSYMDAVTAVSGSGPAYVYMMIEALSDAGVKQGLPRSLSLSLASQTVIGSGKMVQETGLHPAVLKEAVTSPGGTTITAVAMLEKLGFRNAIHEAVESAKKRSEILDKRSQD